MHAATFMDAAGGLARPRTAVPAATPLVTAPYECQGGQQRPLAINTDFQGRCYAYTAVPPCGALPHSMCVCATLQRWTEQVRQAGCVGVSWFLHVTVMGCTVSAVRWRASCVRVCARVPSL